MMSFASIPGYNKKVYKTNEIITFQLSEVTIKENNTHNERYFLYLILPASLRLHFWSQNKKAVKILFLTAFLINVGVDGVEPPTLCL